MLPNPGSFVMLVFRTDAERGMPPILRDVLKRRGWQEYDEEVDAADQPPFSLFWRTNRFTASQINSAVYPRQRINHYPKSSEITKKDHLFRHLRRMRGVYGALYDFSPVTFGLPNEYVKFCQYFADERERWEAARDKASGDAETASVGPAPTYICKPSDLSRGRKIFVFRDIGDLTYDCSSVVQRYIDRPLLIHGHKVDFRVYVLVTCFQPLRAYIYDDLLARFSVEKYDLQNVDNIFAHLTNYSVNKNSTVFDDYKPGIGVGCKWTGAQVRSYFAERGVDFKLLWGRVETLVCLTLLSIASQVPPMPQCFELYGFDVMFDQDFKPWLIEVNFSPALAVEGDVDDTVKRALMNDMIDTLNIQPPDPTPTTPPEQLPANVDSAARAKPPAPAPKRGVGTTRPTPAAGATRRASNSPAVQRASSLGRLSAPKGSASTRSASTAAPQYVDDARGQFRWCFPYSPETQALAKDLAASASSPDPVLRPIIGLLKKREAGFVSGMKGVAAQYRSTENSQPPTVPPPPPSRPTATMEDDDAQLPSDDEVEYT